MLLIMAVLFVALWSHAAEFRSIRAIVGTDAQEPAGEATPLERAAIERAVGDLEQSWNGGDLEAVLDEGFYDRTRLLDAVGDRSKVPPDARLRVMSVQDVQTLDQRTAVEDGSGDPLVVGTVSTTLNTQIEFDDPTRGFQRVDGTNEVILEVVLKPVYE